MTEYFYPVGNGYGDGSGYGSGFGDGFGYGDGTISTKTRRRS